VRFDTSDSKAFTLTTELEVLGALRTLATEQRLIQLRVPSVQASILTTLLHIDSKNDALIFDGTSDASLSRQIFAAEKLHFEASESGVHISFQSGPAASLTFEDRPALRMPVPAELVRVQRRENFRVATPLSNPVLCAIPQKTGLINLPLSNLSATGMGASDPGHALISDVNDIISDCRLLLPAIGPVDVTLRLVHIRVFEHADKPQRNLGFAFENLRGAASARIQRYVSTLEREALARNRGW